MIELIGSRPDWIKPILLFLNFFDTTYFYFVLIPIIWLTISYQWGIRFFYWITLSYLLVGAAKYTFGWARPCTDLPELGLLQPQFSGFPSGGAQGAFFLGGLLIYYCPKPIAKVAGVTYILLVSFSRIYLGVHYPLDVLGGWFFGALLLIFLIKSRKPMEQFLSKKGLEYSLLLSLLIPISISFFFPITSYVMGGATGIGLGSYVSLKKHLFLPPPKTWAQRIVRPLTAMILLASCVILLGNQTFFSTSFFAALFLSIAASPICRWIEKRHSY